MDGKVSLMPKLKILLLRGNRIKEISSEMFRGIELVQTVDLRDNMITDIEAQCFYNLKYLKRLKLSNNRLTYIHETAFWSGSLEMLDLSETRVMIQKKNILKNMTNLEC